MNTNNSSSPSSENPLYPIQIDEYPKLFDFVLTANGLKYFHQIKRKYTLGKEMTLDEYNKLRLLYIYYATANKNYKEVYAWQDICITLDDQGIYEKNMYHSKEDLKIQSMIIENPEYQSGLYRKYIEYVKENNTNLDK